MRDFASPTLKLGCYCAASYSYCCRVSQTQFPPGTTSGFSGGQSVSRPKWSGPLFLSDQAEDLTDALHQVIRAN